MSEQFPSPEEWVAIIEADPSISPTSHLAVNGLKAAIDRQNATISELTAMLKDAEERAATDKLTGLGNRNALFNSFVKWSSRQSKRDTGERRRHNEFTPKHALIIAVDLDNFKLVNDVLGYGTGSNTLTLVADIFKEIVRYDTDELYRLGGDEFVFIIPITEGQEDAAFESIFCRFYEKLDEYQNKENPHNLTPAMHEAMRIIDGTFACRPLPLYATTSSIENAVAQTMADIKSQKEARGASLR